MPKQLLRRPMTGTSTLTSAVLPGHISEQTGRPAASITTPTVICSRSGRWSLEYPRSPKVSPPAPANDSERQRGRVEKHHREFAEQGGFNRSSQHGLFRLI